MRPLILVLIFLWGCSPRTLIRKEIAGTEKALHNHVGFYLSEINGDNPLVEYNAEKYFIPASNTKIFTLYTSLLLLGDSIASLKYVQHGDSLLFQGMGDPSFLYRGIFDNGRVYRFLQKQSAKLYFSAGNFQTETLGPGWAWDDYPYYYSAERSAFPLYGNLIAIRHPNDSLFHFMPPRFSGDFAVSSDVRPEEEITRAFDSNALTYFNGAKKSKSFLLTMRTSSDLTTDLLSDTLHRSVEEVNHFPREAKVLRSMPSDSLYKMMMVESDNFIAEQLLLQCAATVSDTLKPEIAIRYATRNFLADLPDPPQWVDGSGLSRFNLFTPRSVAAVWKKIHTRVSEERLFKLLAVGGQSGTLKSWLKADTPFVYGKTGSLNNVRALSGFVITRKKKILIFSFMNNNFTASAAEARMHTEKLLRLVHDKY